MKSILPSFRAALSSIKPVFVGISAASDLVFLVLFGTIYSYLFASTADHIQAVNEQLAAQTAQFVGTQDPSVLALPPEVYVHYHAILAGMAWIALSFYLLWSLTQGIAWWAARRATGKTDFLTVMLNSFRLNIMWMVAGGILLFGVALIAQESSLSPFPIIGPEVYTTITFVLFGMLHYFMVVSYAHIDFSMPLRTSVRAAWNHIRFFGPVFVLSALGIILGGMFVVKVGMYNHILGLLVLLCIMLPWLALCRIWMTLLAGHHGHA